MDRREEAPTGASGGGGLGLPWILADLAGRLGSLAGTERRTSHATTADPSLADRPLRPPPSAAARAAASSLLADPPDPAERETTSPSDGPSVEPESEPDPGTASASHEAAARRLARQLLADDDPDTTDTTEHTT
ncbi:MAG: hypothetical protein ACK5OX_18190 [Desertimonas sp.]